MALKLSLLWESLVLLVAGLLGTVCVIPYALHTLARPLSGDWILLRRVIISQTLRNALLLALAVPLGLIAAHRVGLGAPIVEALVNGRPISHIFLRMLPKAVIWGSFAGLSVLLLDSLLFAAVKLRIEKPQFTASIWQYLLASVYGGITEEILTRLFLFSVLAWLFSKFSHAGDYLAPQSLWIVNFIVAVIFGIGHLGMTRAVMGLTPVTIARAVMLNGPPGLIFGWLYWRYGLEAAMFAHLCADLVVLPVTLFVNKSSPRTV